MPFKEKANKKIPVNKKSTITLDSKHNEKIDEFYNNEVKVIPNLKKEILDLKKKISKK